MGFASPQACTTRIFCGSIRIAGATLATPQACKISGMAKPRLNVGLIGYQFMGKAHSNAYRQAGRYFDLPYEIGMKTICGRTAAVVQEAADNLGWQQTETDWRKVVEDPEIDIIDISTP